MQADSKDFEARRAKALGGLLRRAWKSGAAIRPDLAALPVRARDVAAQTAGGPWLDALDTLVASLREEARLNEVGITFAHVQITRLLQQRLKAHRLWHARPEIAELPVAAPIVVLGHMRSGTTRLQRLLGCDPRFNHTRFFEVMRPVAPQPDWRVVESACQVALLGLLNPEIDTVHPTNARAVEEVFGLLAFSFYGAQFEAQWRVPGFARYWEAQDRAWVYAELKQLLRTIAWQRGANAAPWVLKAPQFMEDLAPLLAHFPGARLVCMHRDAGEIVPSTASLVCHQMQVQSDAVDRCWIGAEWLRKTTRREALCAEVRRARPDVPQLDVDFAAMNADWRGEMRRIYGFLDVELTPAVEARMARYLRAAEKSGFRGHRYRAVDFGLDAEAMRGMFAAARA